MDSANVDPSFCPLCGDANACAMVEGGSSCWCFNVTIPKDVLSCVPPKAQGCACVCQNCAKGTPKPAAQNIDAIYERLGKR